MRIERKTNETDIVLDFKLYGSSQYKIMTPLPFFTHMLEQFAKHGRFDLELTVTGDDGHHIIEDVGIALGQAFSKSLLDKTGIERYADACIPMDDALVQVAIDCSGRSFLSYDVTYPSSMTSGFESEWVLDFIAGFLQEFKIALHLRKLSGVNTHHLIEAVFKGLAITLRRALTKTTNQLPTTKGVL